MFYFYTNTGVLFYQCFNTEPVYILMPTSSPGIQLVYTCFSFRLREQYGSVIGSDAATRYEEEAL